MIRFADHPNCWRRERTRSVQGDAYELAMTVNSGKADADVSHRFRLIRCFLSSLHHPNKNSPWRIRPRRIHLPHLRPLNFVRSSQSPRPAKVTLNARSWGVAHVSCYWNHREIGQSFVRVVRFKFPPDASLYTCCLTVRKGERTPVSVRMSEAPANIPSTWPLCKEGRRFEAAVADLTGSSTLRVERVMEKGDGSLESGEW